MDGKQNLPKLLIVEDAEGQQRAYASYLAGQAEIIPAFTIREGWQKFQEHKDTLTLIVMDACVPGDSPTTPPLIRDIREAGFTGPMIATSGADFYRQTLMSAGCDVDGKGKWSSVVLIVAEILKARESVTASSDSTASRPTANVSVSENRLVS